MKRLDYFVSHAWRSPRLAKYFALLVHLNLDAALIAYLATCVACFVYSILAFESVPAIFVLDQQPLWFDNVSLRCLMLAQSFAPISLVLVFFFGHLFLRRGEKAFLDIACIDQLDAENKAAGISSLGALLDRSQRMVVLLDEHNMRRMWCVFEVAAFAKRGSIERMDLVPLHSALQIGSFVCIFLLGLLLNAAAVFSHADVFSGGSSDDGSEQGQVTFMAVMLPFILPPFLLLVQATIYGQATARALDDLRQFSIADVECYSDLDRAAILELIGRWFADNASAISGGTSAEAKLARDIGVHNFETFVRMEVCDKLERTIGGAGTFQWPLRLSLLFFMFSGGGWFFDQSAVPEETLWQLLSAVCLQVMNLVAAPAFGFGISLTASLISYVRERCGCGFWLSLGLLGAPGIAFSLALYMATTAFQNPFAMVAGSDTKIGQMVFPDDGLDPDSSRRVIKLQVVILVVTIFLTFCWIASRR